MEPHPSDPSVRPPPSSTWALPSSSLASLVLPSIRPPSTPKERKTKLTLDLLYENLSSFEGDGCGGGKEEKPTLRGVALKRGSRAGKRRSSRGESMGERKPRARLREEEEGEEEEGRHRIKMISLDG